MRRLAAALVILLSLLAPARTDAHVLCSVFAVCPYVSPGFTLTVVEAESNKPIADVYAWAEWVQYGAHGLNGPIMIQEALSGPDGRLVFPWWGPRFGYRAGLDIGSDPAVILFKSGYATLIVQNGERPGMRVTDAIRIFTSNGETVKLQPFRGSRAEWIDQLSKLIYPAVTSSVSDSQRDQFRGSYLRRLERVEAEVAKLPQESPEVVKFRSSLGLSGKFLQGGRR
jgi:hypothetical protein